MSNIFISYAHEDLELANRIVDALAAHKVDTWINWKSIPKGENWEQEIYRGIEEADAFLFLVSPDSVASEMCNKEIAHAVKNGKRILPILISSANIEKIHAGFYTKEAKEEISKRNYIFYREGQDDFARAIEETRQTIHTDYEWLKYHTELQVKALKWEQKKDNSRLLRGKELREAEQQLAEFGAQEDPQPTKIQREYILASQKNEVRQRRQITLGLGGGLIVMIALSFFAWAQRNTAVSKENARATLQAKTEEQAEIALARQLAAQAQSVFDKKDSNQHIAVLLATQSMKMFPTVDAAEVLQNHTLVNPLAKLKQEFGEQTEYIAFNSDGKYVATRTDWGIVHVWETATWKEITHMNDVVGYFAFSPDGKYITSGGGVWEITTGKEISRIDHDVESCVAFSPTGKYIVSCGRDTVRVWEANTGKEIARMNQKVDAVAFSPDGKYIVSGGYDGARVWEANTGKEIARMTYDKWGVTSVAFSPDGQYVVSGGVGHIASVWETSTGKEISRMKHNDDVASVAFSPDGKYVLSGSYDGTARVWESLTGKEIARMTHDNRVRVVAFSPDGQYVVSGSQDGTARIWEANTGIEVSRMMHDYWVLTVAFSPDGKYLATGNVFSMKDYTAFVWEVFPKREISHMTYDYEVDSVAFSPNGQYIISSDRGETRVWDITKGIEVLSANYVNSSLSLDGKHIVTDGCDDGKWKCLQSTTLVQKIDTGVEVSRMTHKNSHYVTSLAFSPNGKYVVFSDDTVYIWEVSSGKEVAHMTYTNKGYFAISPDSKYVALAGCDQENSQTCVKGSVCVWEINTGREVSCVMYEDWVTLVAFSPDGQYVVSGSDDKTARVWKAVTGKEVARMTHNGGVTAVAFSPDGKYVVSGSGDKTARVWEASTGKEIARMTHEYYGVNSVAFSPNGKHIVSIDDDNSAHIWEASTGKEIFNMAPYGVISAAFSPDNSYIVIGSYDGIAHVWEINTGKEIAHMIYGGGVYSVTFSPNGKYIASGGCEEYEALTASTVPECVRGSARVWIYRPEDLIQDACLYVGRNLTFAEWTQYIGDALSYQAVCPNLPIEPEITITPAP